MKSKLELIKNYIDEMLSNSISITGFRYEICCKGNLSLQQAIDIFRSYQMMNGIPEGIETATTVSTMECEELVQFAYVEYEDIGRGRASNQPSIEKKADMATLLNCLGLFSTKLERLLSIKSRIQNDPPVDNEPVEVNDELEQIMHYMKVRKAAKNNLFVCAMVKRTGGCTKAFSSTKELANHVYERFGPQWRHSIMLTH